MASAAEETDAGIEICLEAIERLKSRNPRSELLQFSESFAMMPPPDAFVAQFGEDNISETHRGTEFAAAAMFNNYYFALEAA